MTTFIGTEEEYHRHVGPRIRNKVQTMTKQYRSSACQHCGTSGVTIEAAHVHGRERKQIIHEIIEPYWNGKEYVLNLDQIEQKIVVAHEPIESAFLFLCKNCHTKYDSQTEKSVKPISRNPNHPEKDCSMKAKSNKYYALKIQERIMGGDFSDSDIIDFQDEQYCKSHFNLQFPLLTTKGYLCYSENNPKQARYYSESFAYKGQRYNLCNHWYAGINKEYLWSLAGEEA